MERARLDRSDELDLFHELGEVDEVASARTRLEPDFRQRNVNQIAQAEERAAEHEAGVARDPHRAGLQRLVSELGVVQEIAQLVREDRQAFRVLAGDGAVALA